MSDADDGLPFDAWEAGEGGVHPDDNRRTKHTGDTMARVDGPLVGSRLEPGFGDEITTRIELLDVTRPKVPIATAVEAVTDDGATVEIGTIARLSPSQAEELAGALSEHAEAAREFQGGNDD